MRQARRIALGLGLALAVLTPALAYAPERSLRPQARLAPTAESVQRQAAAGVVILPTKPIPRPRARPVITPQIAATAPVAPAPVRAGLLSASPLATLLSPRPKARPNGMLQQARVRQQTRLKGAVCGDPALQGEVIGRVEGQISGCGIDDAVRLRSVSGVRLSQAAMIDCPTAKALKRWVENGMTLSLRSKGQVSELRVASHYACRPRNNQAGARISEHGRGRAIDISGFVMKNGRVITVLDGWDHPDTRRAMRRMHKTACGVFGTVLGPDSDRFHLDHFHFDTARYRNGAYCR